MSEMRRVVVTGVGLVTCLGTGVNHVWRRVIDGQCGISKITGLLDSYGWDDSKLPCKVAGIVPTSGDESISPMLIERYIDRSDQPSFSPSSKYAIYAAEEALSQANWRPGNYEDEIVTGIAVGLGMSRLDSIYKDGHLLYSQGYRKLSPYFIPRNLPNQPASLLSLRFGFKGPQHCVSTACATGAHGVGDAYRFIQHGDADVMLCGGTEECLTPLAMAGFARMKALSTRYNDTPSRASRPFDAGRDGFVMSEGAGMLVLEELGHALSRGAPILGEILGYGLSGDAHHITAPSGDGDGAYRCMAAALRSAGLTPNDVGYINAHATSTPLGDVAESRAISRLFTNTKHLAVSSTKGALGHLLGAAGSAEVIISLMACSSGVIPPTLNCENPLQDYNLNYVPINSQEWRGDGRRIALCNSFGFGGTNAALCLSAFEPNSI